ncbi:MAG TPA: cytochrome c biogenesis protein CcsA [Saprospiraceae bacterium]|nr:cytochrome c biogenesis protein CcsA [Saprospiraceae bacterium]
MKGIWWKSLTVCILLYVILAGFLVPLRPGISDVSPGRVVAGEAVVLKVEGYNTFFTRAKDSIHAWLKLNDEYAFPAKHIIVSHDASIDVQFEIPDTFPLRGTVHPMSLILTDDTHGSFVLPNAVFVRDCQYFDPPDGIWENVTLIDLQKVKGFYFPYRNILHETIRNAYFHIPMWFGMIIIFIASAWCSLRYIRKGNAEEDLKALALNSTGTLFGVLGLLTGMLWSKFTWGSFWSWDVKQNTAAIAVLIYLAYFVLRNSLPDPDRRARVAAVYNIFGCAMLIPLLFVIPRLTDSLHPGSGGNPALGGEDLDNTMRTIFYPAVIGWTLLGVWISELRYRLLRLHWWIIFGK